LRKSAPNPVPMDQLELLEWSVPGSKKRSSPTQGKAPKIAHSVAQARINRICEPSMLRGQTYLAWTSKMRRDPAYTSEWLMVRLTELKVKITALNATVRYEDQPPQLTVPEYLKLWDKLDKLQGQTDAILQVLEERARSGRGSSPTPISISSALAAGPDPFLGQ